MPFSDRSHDGAGAQNRSARGADNRYRKTSDRPGAPPEGSTAAGREAPTRPIPERTRELPEPGRSLHDARDVRGRHDRHDSHEPHDGRDSRDGRDSSAGDQPPEAADGEERRGRFASAGRHVGRGARASARVTGRGAHSAYRLARRASHAEGAGESGLARLFELNAVSTAGDAAVAVAMAGTLFFQVPSAQARGQVGLFLGLTMLPFVVIAPLIGPFLDRYRRGRRWAIGATLALRAFLAWVLASAVASGSDWQFGAALGVLISAKAYGVTRAAATPRLLPPKVSLVKANARMNMSGLAGSAIGGPIAAGLSFIGPAWTLRFAFLVFIGGTIQAILLPARVDSSEGEDDVDVLEPVKRRLNRLRHGVTRAVVLALRCNVGLRALSGFLTIFMAFLLRTHPFPGWEHRTSLLLALVVGAAGVGSAIGTGLGALLRTRPPQLIVMGVLVLDVVVAVATALFFGLLTAVLFGLTAGLCQQLGKVALDSIIQDEVPDRVRTSVFARSETLLQTGWVLGGGLGIILPLRAELG
ncbi:MAG TPA: MFS transporter, partial [Segeticoccus sp.]|uniref:MFS transporter n=1 Tax=Segeticoccus sp. TaxID=2706531 RepID=UPI002D7FC03E